MRVVSKSDFIQMITKNFQKLNIFKKSSTNFILQNFTIIIQSFSVFDTAACKLSTKISINLMSELIYFDLIKNELSASMNNEMIFFMRNTLMFYSWLIMLTIQSHDRKSSEDNVRLSIR